MVLDQNHLRHTVNRSNHLQFNCAGLNVKNQKSLFWPLLYNLTQTCQIQLAFPHLASGLFACFYFSFPLLCPKNHFLLVLLPFFPCQFAFTILWTHAWIRLSLTFSHSPPALFLAIVLPCQHRHCHSFPTQRHDTITWQGSCCIKAMHIVLAQISPATPQKGLGHKQTEL